MPPGARASRNCGNCRAVKRRCDQQLPHCGQCIRLREECPSYRDEWELVFHDQTSHTIKRSKGKQTNAALTETKHSPPICGPSPSTDEVGVNYFLYHFVIGGPSPSRGYLNYVPAVYSADGEHPTLVASMAAVGLAALANATQQPELAKHARAKYWEAIQNVNTALASPTESVKDSTLMSVISLTLFEHVSHFETWFRHIQGAVALVVARGKKQFSSPAAVLMFNQVRADMSAACIHSLRPFPEEMLELQDEATKHADTSSGFWLLGMLAIRCSNLLSNVTHKKGAPLAGYIEEATVLQSDFQHVLRILTEQEPYTTTRTSSGDPEIFYNGRFDLYQSSWAIRVWNNARMLQIVVCEVIFHLLNRMLATAMTPACRTQIETKLQETLQILLTLGDDLLASVPQALGYISSVSEPHTSINSSTHASVSGRYLLMWCLYTVGKSPVTGSRTRKWVMRRLQDIGENAGIAMALQFVDDVDEIDNLAGQL